METSPDSTEKHGGIIDIEESRRHHRSPTLNRPGICDDVRTAILARGLDIPADEE